MQGLSNQGTGQEIGPSLCINTSGQPLENFDLLRVTVIKYISKMGGVTGYLNGLQFWSGN